MLVNHVMSSDAESSIFQAFIRYLSQHSAEQQHVISERALPQADIYHYHRINLEQCLKRPSIATVHHDLSERDRWLALEQFLPRYRECAQVVCLNHTQAELLAGHGISHTRVIPHGYNPKVIFHQASPSVDEPQSPYTLGMFSKRYGRRVKGEAYLMELMRKLDPDRVRFVFVGEGRAQEVVMAESLGFTASCYERLPYRLFGQLYQSIDALLVTSWYEGGPACVPEAVAAGVPIIGTPVGMVKDLVSDGDNGFWLSGEAQRDARRLNTLFLDAQAVAGLRQGAYERRQLAKTWAQVAASYAQLYQQIQLRYAA